MSLVAPSHSHRSTKRGFDSSDANENHPFHNVHTPQPKARRLGSGGRCSPAAGPLHAVCGPTTIAALRSLFPAMNEQTISAVLTDCGSDIDAAIKRLGQLQLRIEQVPAQASAEQQATASPSGSAAAEASAPGPGVTNGTATPPAPELASPAPPKTSEEWVEALVQTMSQAKDIPDARNRAAQALQAFEQATLAAAQVKADHSTQQLQRDNAILKRAVAIQNSRLQELAGRDAELTSVKALAKQYHERIQSLQLTNYSLAQHLRQATDGRSMDAGRRDPHVF